MLLSADRRGHDGAYPDEGFTLIEVIVALGITLVVMAALLPQLIVGIRGTALANDVTEAKGVLQGQLERMRNMPYHVAPSAASPGLGIDVLDTYFPDIQPPGTATFSCSAGGRYVTPQGSWSGYVKVATGIRCPYEPASGSFYRTVETSAGYVVVTDTQFLNSLSRGTPGSPTYQPIVAETAGPYNSRTGGIDTPVSSQIGVTVTVFYLNRGTTHPVSAYTQISEVVRSPTRVQGVANVRAIEVGGITPGGQPLSVSAGEVNISGALTRSSTASVDAAAVSARRGADDPMGLRLPTVLVPPSASKSSQDAGAGTLPVGICDTAYACWGPATLDPVTASADGGLPNVGTPNPVEARVTGAPGISLRNTVVPDLGLLQTDTVTGLGLDATKPMVSMTSTGAPVTASGCGTSRGGWVTGRGYLTTTGARVASCAEAATSAVSLLPTALAPGGLIRLTLLNARAQCTADHTTHTKTAQTSYQLKVEYFDPTAPGGYRAMTTTGVDPLPALETVAVGGLHLSNYIDSWTLSAPTSSSTTSAASLPGVLKLTSQPLRINDPSSAISLTLGAVSCDAEDAR